jgi:hypothetical protein
MATLFDNGDKKYVIQQGDGWIITKTKFNDFLKSAKVRVAEETNIDLLKTFLRYEESEFEERGQELILQL